MLFGPAIVKKGLILGGKLVGGVFFPKILRPPDPAPLSLRLSVIYFWVAVLPTVIFAEPFGVLSWIVGGPATVLFLWAVWDCVQWHRRVKAAREKIGVKSVVGEGEGKGASKVDGIEIREGTEADREGLLSIWLRSVRETHDFLSEADIEELMPEVFACFLGELELWVAEEEGGGVMGFMGLNGNSLDALFLDPKYFRKGVGRAMVERARAMKGRLKVDVNEGNEGARLFYEAVGFEICGRSEVDGQGRAFPLLHMREVCEGDEGSG